MEAPRQELPRGDIPPEAGALLEEATFGFLGLAEDDDGYPVVLPVNFVCLGGDVVFHGSPDGGKMRALARDDRVTFTVAAAYSLIPSHFGGPSDACGASQYFVSVVIRGRARVVEDAVEKGAALNALMEKLQPEGGYRRISAEDPGYRASLDETAAVRIAVESMSARVKLGQGFSVERRERIISKLAERGRPADLKTIEAMRRAAGATK